MKKITEFFSLIIVTSMMVYSAFIVGTLFHELTHAKNAEQLHYIHVNYDGSGETSADVFIDDNEEKAYLNGAVVTASLILLSQFSLFILLHK